jgi:hypothetical protein
MYSLFRIAVVAAMVIVTGLRAEQWQLWVFLGLLILYGLLLGKK